MAREQGKYIGSRCGILAEPRKSEDVMQAFSRLLPFWIWICLTYLLAAQVSFDEAIVNLGRTRFQVCNAASQVKAIDSLGSEEVRRLKARYNDIRSEVVGLRNAIDLENRAVAQRCMERLVGAVTEFNNEASGVPSK